MEINQLGTAVNTLNGQLHTISQRLFERGPPPESRTEKDLADWCRRMVYTELRELSELVYNAASGFTAYAIAAGWSCPAPPFTVIDSRERQRLLGLQQKEDALLTREKQLTGQVKDLSEQLTSAMQMEEDARKSAKKAEEEHQAEVLSLRAKITELEARVRQATEPSGAVSRRLDFAAAASSSAPSSGAQAGVRAVHTLPVRPPPSQPRATRPPAPSTATSSGSGVRAPPGLPVNPAMSPAVTLAGMLQVVQSTVGPQDRSRPHGAWPGYDWTLAHRLEAEAIARVAELLLEMFRRPSPPP